MSKPIGLREFARLYPRAARAIREQGIRSIMESEADRLILGPQGYKFGKSYRPALNIQQQGERMAEIEIGESEMPEVTEHLARMTGPASKGKTPAHFAAEFLADEANMTQRARANAKALGLLLGAWIPNIDIMSGVLPIAMELQRRFSAGEIQEIGPAAAADRRDLIGIAKAYRAMLLEYPPCSDNNCGQAVCLAKRDGLVKVDAVLSRVEAA